MARRRILTEYRLMTVLAHGGMVAPMRQAFVAYRGPDTRRQVAGWVSPHIMARLRAEGRLRAQADFPDRWQAVRPPQGTVPQATPCPEGLLALQARGDCGLAEVLLDGAGGPDAIRQRAAAGRFRDEFTRASQPGPAQMRPVAAARPEAGPSDRLAALEAEIGPQAMRQLEDLLIDRATVMALRIRWGGDGADVRAGAREALARLAVAYELSPAADRPA